MVYAELDPVIRAWVDRHGLKLFTALGGEEARFCYVTGGPQECFQVWIEPPQAGSVVVRAASIETIDDAELAASWVVPLDELDAALDLALEKIGGWKNRPKGPPTWRPIG